MNKSARSHIDDFEARKGADPGSVIRVEARAWEYIPVHPMSNESQLLKSLSMRPEDCVGVDCYWNIENDVVFLQVQGSKSGWEQRPGLYARLPTRRRNPMLNLVAVVREPAISQNLVERVMADFFDLQLESKVFSRKNLGDQLTLIKSY